MPKTARQIYEDFTVSKFGQQEMPAWRPANSQKYMLYLLLGLFLLSTAFGGIGLASTVNKIQIIERYDNKCDLNHICKIQLEVPKQMSGNIRFSYLLNPFYQNHRKFASSRNDDQLAGEYVSYSGLSDCYPYIYRDNKSDLYLPCGLSAVSFMNDTFKWQNDMFSEVEIATAPERETLFQPLNVKYTEGYRWLEDYTNFPNGQINEHFMIWMRTAATPEVKKLYMQCIACVIKPGTYNVTIGNYYPTSSFKGKKYIVLEEYNSLGGYNIAPGVGLIAVAFLSLISFILLLIYVLYKPRKEGSMKLIQQQLYQLQLQRRDLMNSRKIQ